MADWFRHLGKSQFLGLKAQVSPSVITTGEDWEGQVAHMGSTGEAICRSYPVPTIGSHPPSYPCALTGIKVDMGSPSTSGLVDVSSRRPWKPQRLFIVPEGSAFLMVHTSCSYRKTLRMGLVVHTCNPSPREQEAGGRCPGQSGLQTRPCLKNKTMQPPSSRSWMTPNP